MNLFEEYLNNDEIIVKTDAESGLASVKYRHMGVDWSKPEILQARGLIVNTAGEIIARPYEKFFNYNQLKDLTGVDASTRKLSMWTGSPEYVSDKADGSLVITFTYEDELYMASSGQVNGNFSKLFFDLLDTKYREATRTRLTELGRVFTIMMEYVGPGNQIVVPYNETKFILHGARNTKTGEYLNLLELQELSKYLGIELIEVYPELNSLEAILGKLNTLKNKEGFVVVFEDGKRLKFKTEEYIELHSVVTPFFNSKITQNTVKTFYTLIMEDNLDDLLPVLAQFSEGKQKQTMQTFVNESLAFFEAARGEVSYIKEYIQDLINEGLDRKTIANLVFTGPLKSEVTILPVNVAMNAYDKILKCADVDLNTLACSPGVERVLREKLEKYLNTKITIEL